MDTKFSTMNQNNTITVPTGEEVSQESKEIFNGIEKSLGFLPNLYAVIGHSSNALKHYLQWEGAMTGKSSFSKKEEEAIKLVISEVNGCQYCLAAHTFLGQQFANWELNDTIAIRGLNVEDVKLKSLLVLTAEITSKQGNASDKAKSTFFDQGYTQENLMDLVSIVSIMTMTNFLHNLSGIPIDSQFPLAKSI